MSHTHREDIKSALTHTTRHLGESKAGFPSWFENDLGARGKRLPWDSGVSGDGGQGEGLKFPRAPKKRPLWIFPFKTQYLLCASTNSVVTVGPPRPWVLRSQVQPRADQKISREFHKAKLEFTCTGKCLHSIYITFTIFYIECTWY